MDFNLSQEQALIQKMVRAFTENEVKPIAAETDKTCEYPRENIEKLFDYGIMGMCVPKEYGGSGADDLSSALAIEELSKACASTGDIVATHNGLCCDPILRNGTEEQKQKYLRMLTQGRKVGAFALTEPNAGSDASKGTTTAVLEGDHYVLNGSKIFITNGYVADVAVVFAMTDPSKGTRGISAFIVESSFPGYSVGKHEEKMGLHGSPTAELVFTDCIVPKENLLGQEGKGFKIAMQTLDGGRIGIAAQALGHRRGRRGGGHQLHQGPHPVRQAHLPVPEHPVRLCRHEGRHGGRPPAHLPGRLPSSPPASPSPRRPPWPSCSPLRERHVDHHQGSADVRRLRLHQGLPHGAHDARRQDHTRSTRAPARFSASSSPATWV